MWFQVLLVTVPLFVALMLGALGGAAAFAKYGTRRRVLKWDAAEQLRIVPQQLSEIIGNPVVVHAGTGDVDELSLVVVGLIAAGNSVLEPVTVGITTNPGSEILGTRVVDATNGVCVTISCRNQTARQIEIATLRPGNRIIVNMVVRSHWPRRERRPKRNTIEVSLVLDLWLPLTANCTQCELWLWLCKIRCNCQGDDHAFRRTKSNSANAFPV